MKTILRFLFAVLVFTAVQPVIAGNGHDPFRGGRPWMNGIPDSSDWGEFNCFRDDFHFDDFPFCRSKNKYNGHWAGIEIGINGYVTPDFDMNFDAYPWMNMNTARSLMINFNPFELNVNLIKNHFGFTTGLGFQTGNFYFTDNFVLIKDSSSIVAYKAQDANGNPEKFKVNKMVISYLNLPLLFEYQTNRFRRMNSFHVSAGVIGGVRIGTYTKQTYEEKEGQYYLVDSDGNRVASYYVEHHLVRDRGAYHLSPFKLDAAFRIGWSHLNLFATYSLTPMFEKNKGPELYPFTVGLTLLGW